MSPLRPKSLKTYPGWKQLSAPQLWDTWLGVCEGNKDRAITHAVWFCALEIKRIASHWNHLKFASIRDEFVRRHSVSGVQIKRLTLPCLTCRGSGIEPLRTRKRCTVCRGTGARREFYNYAHTLNVYGGIMILHSIVPPPLLGSQALQEYYVPTVPAIFPFAGYLKMLGTVARGEWDLQFARGRYIRK